MGPHSLARSSKRTTGRRHHDSYTPLAGVSFIVEVLSRPRRSIATRFQALLTSLFRVLFSFRSLYYCAIGLEICLALGEGVPRIPARYPTHGTQEQATSFHASATGLSPSLAPRSRGISLAWLGLKGRLTTPHLPAITGRIRFRLCCFHSPLLAASHVGFSSSPYADVSTRGVPGPTGPSL